MEILIDDKGLQEVRDRKVILERWAAVTPENQRSPSGIKYRFHACYGDGTLILRYDNSDARNKHNAKHHKHMIENDKEIIEPLKIKPKNERDLFKLHEKWKTKVIENVRRM